jgi:hypothetical protein
MLRRWKASCFHATDFYNGAKEFKRNTSERERLFEADSRLIPELIGEHIQRMLLVAFRPAEFMRKVPPHWRDRLGTSIHSQAVQLCLISNGYWLAENHRRDSFAYFMESGDADQGEVTKSVEKMRQDLACAPVINMASFTTVEKGVARGSRLQISLRGISISTTWIASEKAKQTSRGEIIVPLSRQRGVGWMNYFQRKPNWSTCFPVSRNKHDEIETPCTPYANPVQIGGTRKPLA